MASNRAWHIVLGFGELHTSTIDLLLRCNHMVRADSCKVEDEPPGTILRTYVDNTLRLVLLMIVQGLPEQNCDKDIIIGDFTP